MLLDNEKTTEQMTNLFTEARNYWQLQRKNLSFETAEVLTRLLSAVALWGIVILIGALVLLFSSFALAYLLGNLMGNAVWGFGIIAGILLLLTLLVYANRRTWIYVPVGKFLLNLFASQTTAMTSEAVAIEKAQVKNQLEVSEAHMRLSANALLTPAPEAKDRWERATRLVSNSMNIYRALQIGISAVAAFRAVFGLGKRRRRK